MTLTVDVKEDIYKIHKTKIYNYNWQTPLVNAELTLLTTRLKIAMLALTNYNFRIYSADIIEPDTVHGFVTALYVQNLLAEITQTRLCNKKLIITKWMIYRYS